MNGAPLSDDEISLCWGLTKNVDHVQVWIVGEPYRISKTSLIHELVHVTLKVTKNTYDADHMGDKYDAWTVEHTKLIKVLNAKLFLKSL